MNNSIKRRNSTTFIRKRELSNKNTKYEELEISYRCRTPINKNNFIVSKNFPMGNKDYIHSIFYILNLHI